MTNEKDDLTAAIVEAQQVLELHELRALNEQLQKAKTGVQLAEQQVPLEQYTIVNPYTPYFDWPEWGAGPWGPDRAASYNDRQYGRWIPHWSNEHQWRIILNQCNWVAETYEPAIHCLGLLTNYTIHTGLKWEVVPREEGAVTQGFIDLCNELVNDSVTLSNLDVDTQREWFADEHKEGEKFLYLEPFDNGLTRIQRLPVINCTEVTGNGQSILERDLLGNGSYEWFYGVVSEPMRPDMVIGYFFQWGYEPQNWSFYFPDQIVHTKLNVPERVKRGLSDFYSPRRRMLRTERLHDNTVVGAGHQAAIALIREHVDKAGPVKRLGTTSRIVVRDEEDNSQLYFQEKSTPGQIIDQAGVKITPGPMGQSNSTDYVEVAKESMRVFGQRWHFPEFMMTGDANSANYSTALAAEGPFQKSIQSLQRTVENEYAELFMRVLEMAGSNGRRLARRYPQYVRRLRKLVQVEVKAPDTSARDQLKDSERYKLLNESFVMSKETWASREGIDWEEEAPKIEEEKAQQQEEMQAQAEFLGSRLRSATDDPFDEQWEEADCGANAPGGGGFQKGNTCAKGGKGSQRKDVVDALAADSAAGGQSLDDARKFHNERGGRVFAKIEKKPWQSSQDLTAKDRRGRKNQADTSKWLKKMRDKGFVQVAWDNQGVPHYAPTGEALPKWLTQSDDDAAMAALPARESIQEDACGANAPGGGGFQPGNTCARGGGGGSSTTVSRGDEIPQETLDKMTVTQRIAVKRWKDQGYELWYDERRHMLWALNTRTTELFNVSQSAEATPFSFGKADEDRWQRAMDRIEGDWKIFTPYEGEDAALSAADADPTGNAAVKLTQQRFGFDLERQKPPKRSRWADWSEDTENVRWRHYDGGVDANFTVGENRYEIDAFDDDASSILGSDAEDILGYDFQFAQRTFAGNTDFGPTGAGNGMAVFRNVSLHLSRLMQDDTPDYVRFEATGGKGRKDLYRFFTQRASKVFPDFKGAILKDSGGGDNYYVIYRKELEDRLREFSRSGDSMPIEFFEQADDAWLSNPDFWDALHMSLMKPSAWEDA